MVRYVDIIGDDDKDDKGKEASEKVRLTEAFKKAGQEGSASRAKAGSSDEEYSEKKKDLEAKPIKDLYGEMLSLSLTLLKNVKHHINVERRTIEGTVSKAADAFLEDLYNPLLLYFYYHSETSYLVAHIANDVILTMGFAASLGFSREDLIKIGTVAYCHDIGMIYFKELFDSHHKLSPAKRKLIKTHPIKSVEYVRDIFNEKECSIIYDVHEIESGNGYPFGKGAEDISPWAEIIAICDVYEALTHKRAHRDKFNPYDSMKMMIQMQDKWLKKAYVKMFVDFLSICPVGTLVYLNTGEVAIVVESSREAVTKPVVKVILDKTNKLEKENKIINLSKSTLLFIKEVISDAQMDSIVWALKLGGKLDMIKIENCSVISPFSYFLYGGHDEKS